MKKKILTGLLLAVFVLGISANAVSPRAKSVYPSLSFSGTTASCSVYIESSGDNIVATLELWRGNSLVRSWSDEGRDRLSISGSCGVTKDVTYTLKVTGTIDGQSITCTPVTKTCK